MVYIVLYTDDGDSEPFIDSVWISREGANERADAIRGWVQDYKISHRGNTDF